MDEHKNTAAVNIDRNFKPSEVVIPMQQHIGKPCICAVKKGDAVKIGTLVGIPADGLSCPVHSSVSGTVKDVVETIGINGQKTICAVIENDGENTCEEFTPVDAFSLDAAQIVNVIKNAGISGMGGATFPTYAKINSAIGKVDTLILNCSECEPYITANHRLMLEEPDRILSGLKILLHALSLKTAIIAISDNKQDAIDLMTEKTASDRAFKVQVMKTKYPQGDERQLIYAITKRSVPTGKLPADVGCVVFNTETAAAISNAFEKGEPLVSKVVTIDGDCIVSPRSVVAPIGAKYSDLIAYCGGTTEEPQRIVSGGTMMGFTVWDKDTPVTKGCSSVLAFAKLADQAPTVDAACIRCGRCVRACPMHLMPSYISQYAKKDLLEECDKLGARSCVECGCCSFVCPAKIPVSQFVRTAKARLIALSRR